MTGSVRRRTLQFPPIFGPCELAADTIDREQRRVTVTFLSGQPIARTPLFEDSYFLEFDVTEKAADLSRLNAGASVLDSHRGGDLAAVLGKVERAWIEGDKARAVLRFSRRPEVDGVWQDVADGILGHVSMGVFLEQLEELKAKKGNTEDMRRFAVRRWQPYEISVVGVPADAGARIEAAADERHPCRVTFSFGGEAMDDQNTDSTTDDLDDEAEKPKTRAQLRAENAELRRREQIRRAAEHFDAGDVFAEKHIRLGSDIGAVLEDAAAERKKREPRRANDIGFGDDWDHGPRLHERMAEGLAAQIRGVEPNEAGRQFYGLGFTGVAHELARRRGQHTFIPNGRAGDSRAVELALTTSDYPLILADTANKTLLPAYMAAPATFKTLCARRNFTDFRTQSFVQPGDFPLPLQVAEAGEIKQGYFGERKETGVLAVYGRILNFSRQALVNDDLGAFQQVMQSWGARMADHHNALFFALLTSGAGLGPTMSDTGTLYNATAVTTLGGHANYTSSGTAIADSSLNVGATQMMQQRGGGSSGLGDGIFLNIQPRYLVAPPSKRLLAFQYTSANYVPAAPTSQNAFAGVLTPLLDANLSGNRWHLFADPTVLPSFAYGTLDSEPGPRVTTRAGFEIEGLQMKLAYDIGFACVEWRSTYANAGA